jgi:chromosome segregation ATPase
MSMAEKKAIILKCADFEEAKKIIAQVPTTPGALRRAGVFLLGKIERMQKKYNEMWNELERAHQDLTAREADIARLKEMLVEATAKAAYCEDEMLAWAGNNSVPHPFYLWKDQPKSPDYVYRREARDEIEKELQEPGQKGA